MFRSEKQPKHKVFGRDIPGTSGTQTSGYPRQKLYASGLFLLFLQGVAGMSRDLGRDIPDLEKLYARKLRADFSYHMCCRNSLQESLQSWDPDCVVQGPSSWISPKNRKGKEQVLFKSKIITGSLVSLENLLPQNYRVTVTILKFGRIRLITITVAVLASAVTPSLP